jgi:two-component system, NarL family, invasion response regulator UvrY
MTTRILIVDDHAAVGRGVKEILTLEFGLAKCEVVQTVPAALEKLQREAWDAAIVDLNLPGRGGLEVVQAIKEINPKIRILVYTMHAEEELGVRALMAGADGYLTKDRAPEDLASAVRQILSGSRYISPGLAHELAERVLAGKQNAEDQLSNREHQILRAIAIGKTPTEIADDLALSIKTVSTYRSRILEKLQLKNTAELIRYAINKKLVD